MLRGIREKVETFDYAAVRRFLENLQKYNLSYSSRVRPRFDDGEKAWMAGVLRDAGVVNAEFFQRGVEAALFTDGEHIYKFFYSGIAHFHSRDLGFFASALSPTKNLVHVTPLLGIIRAGDALIFKMPRVDGDRYAGGHLDGFYGLARECKKHGFLTRNLAPENIIVNDDHLVYVDIGRDVVPFSEDGYIQMCKRAYLCYRWHFRPDIKVLMRESLKDTELPELFGFPWFLEAINVHSAYDWMDGEILKIVGDLRVTNLLDYGCRGGQIADKIGRTDIVVACFDIDMAHFSKREHEPSVYIASRNELDERKATGAGFDAVLCNRVLCSIESAAGVDDVLDDLRGLVKGNGRVIVGVCNPFDIESKSTTTHRKLHVGGHGYHDRFPYSKEILSTGTSRTDFHRPLEWYKRRFALHGFEVIELHETGDVDTGIIAPASEILFLVLKPVPLPKSTDVTLVIKASQAEWRTIDLQVKHLVSQLEGPEKFFEKIVVTDDWTGPFSRQYDDADPVVFHEKLAMLVNENYLDRVVVVPPDDGTAITYNKRWFGIESKARRSANGQPVHVTIHGFDQCKTDLVLLVDSDCLIHRPSRDDRYLLAMQEILAGDPDGLTMAMPIRHVKPVPVTSIGDRGNWRVEVRCCLISRKNLDRVLPLENKEVEGGVLEYSWHRAVDNALQHFPLHSYRGSAGKTSFIHVPNERKAGFDEWFSIIKSVERGYVAPQQEGQVDLTGTIREWLGQRDEPIIILARGRDVPVAKIRRCLASLDRQDEKNWGLLLVDAGSANGSAEFLRDVTIPRYNHRVTLYENLEPCAPMENIDFVIRHLCTNPESLIVMVDLDDALIGTQVFSTLMELVSLGVDLTVGTTLRTDKFKEYPVDFANPRKTRGGNVWQHLRTFKKGLFDRIPQEYFQIEGEWVPHAEDWAFMIPLAELAKNPHYIKEAVYFYEPSPDKACRATEERERIIARIMEKPSLKRAD
jgi:SAM-dependent methyltransferase